MPNVSTSLRRVKRTKMEISWERNRVLYKSHQPFNPFQRIAHAVVTTLTTCINIKHLCPSPFSQLTSIISVNSDAVFSVR
jgi:hypothetical protein